MTEIYPDEIIVHGTTYAHSINSEGRHTLRRFNDKSKMWITINFSNEPNNIDEEMMIMLSKEYFRSIGIVIPDIEIERRVRKALELN